MVAGNGNVVGVVDPGVALLRYNGGPTRNLALLPASPALDAGGDALAVDAAGNPLTTDQRGPDFQRVYGGRVDIGAFEAQPIAPLTEAGLQTLLAAADSVTIYANSLTTPDLVAQLVSALGGLTRPTTITLDMEGDPYSTGGITYNPLTAVNLTFVVQNGTLESTGSAVTISGGQATVQNCTLITTGISPTIVVAGGSLNLWSNTVQESTTAANAALSMTGGTVATDSNVFNVNGAGQFVQNTTVNPVSPFLDMFLVNGAAPPLIPLTITVTNTGDSGPGSLRQAVLDATFQGIVDVGRPTIAFAIPTTDPGYDATTGKHTITLTDGAVIIGYGMIIDGPGASTLTVSSNHASPIFEIYGVFSSGVTVSVADLTIENALGGIFNYGTLTVSNSVVADTVVDSGIRNFGTLTVIDSTFSGNAAYSGGGISNAGTLTVSGSTFVGNTADFSGGGIDNIAGTLTISNSTFSGNSAVETGGGISNAGTLTVSGSTFTGNTAAQRGGGIYNQDGALTIANSTFTGNAAQGTSGEGGGIYGVDGTLTVIGSAFTGNSAGFGGAIRSHSGGGPAGLLVSGSTFSGNLATGAPGGAGLYSSRVRINNTVETSYLYITNSTFHGNVATGVSGGVRIQVAGTGPNSSVPTEIVNSTIVGNSAINGGALLPSASYPA